MMNLNRKKREIPVPVAESDVEYICPSASWGDMTGLIPFAAGESTQQSSYKEVSPAPPEYDAGDEN